MECQQGGSSKQQLGIRIALPGPFQVRFHGWQADHTITWAQARGPAVVFKVWGYLQAVTLDQEADAPAKSCGWTECLAACSRSRVIPLAFSLFSPASFCRSQAHLVQCTWIIIRTFWRGISVRNQSWMKCSLKNARSSSTCGVAVNHSLVSLKPWGQLEFP